MQSYGDDPSLEVVEDERLDEVVQNGSYLKETQDVLRTHCGLWFTDEQYVVSRRHQ